MKVEYINNTNNDLMVANTARVSFNKWNESLDERDPRLINYLASHGHKSPFWHVRFTLLLPMDAIDLYSITDPTYLMGAVWSPQGMIDHVEYMKFRTSIYGWIRMLKEGIINEPYVAGVYSAISSINSGTELICNAYRLDELYDPEWGYSENYLYTDVETDPQFIDVSMRITCPIPIARQMYTHRMFVSNEVSRRYVSDSPTIHEITELRKKPEGSIKQGSSNETISTINVYDSETDTYGTYDAVNVFNATNRKTVALYNDLIALGAAPEQARFLLPQAMETTFIFTGSIAAWKGLLKERTYEGAQLEIRELADMIKQELSNHGH